MSALGKLSLAVLVADALDLGQGDDGVGVTDNSIHLLQSTTPGLVEEQVEEECVGEAANSEDEVVLPS